METPPFYTSQIVSPAAQPFTQVTLLISSPGYVSIRVVNLMVFPLTETTFTQNIRSCLPVHPPEPCGR